MNEDSRTTISLSKALFAEFKRLRERHGYTTEGFVKRLLREWKSSLADQRAIDERDSEREENA